MTATPRLVADLDVLERNIDAMASLGRDAGVALRPHVKTHKMPEIATMQRDAGARGITVATIGEAEVFVDAGFDDVFIAYPLWVDDEAGRRLRALAERARVGVGCDSMTAARQLRKPLGSAVVEVLVELDSGQHRTGIPARDAGELAAGIASLGFDVRGVFTFPGHSYSPEGRAQSTDDERAALAGASRALRAKGIEPHVRSGGSSPSMAFAARNRAGEGARGHAEGCIVVGERPHEPAWRHLRRQRRRGPVDGCRPHGDAARRVRLQRCAAVGTRSLRGRGHRAHRTRAGRLALGWASRARCRVEDARCRQGALGERPRSTARPSRRAHRADVRASRRRRHGDRTSVV